MDEDVEPGERLAHVGHEAVEARVDAGRPCLRLELVPQRADAVDLQAERSACEPRGLEQDVDPFPVLEVRRHPRDEHVVGAFRAVDARGLDPVRDHVHESRRKAVLQHEVRHRLRRRDHVTEPRQRRLDPEVALQEPGDPRARDARRVGGFVPSDPRRDLFGHPVERMEHARAAEPAGEAAE